MKLKEYRMYFIMFSALSFLFLQVYIEFAIPILFRLLPCFNRMIYLLLYICIFFSIFTIFLMWEIIDEIRGD